MLSACDQEKNAPVVPETEKPLLQLEKVSFKDLKNFDKDNLSDFLPAWKRSCEAIEKNGGASLQTAEIKIPAQDYLDICKKLSRIKTKNLKQFIQANFVPYRVTYDGSSEGKFTSYYEAAINASYKKSDVYRHPIYGRPDDLIELNLQDFDATLPSKRLVGRVDGNKFVPYYTREEIFNSDFSAPVILWADNDVDVYVMQIQGSAVAQLDDGSKVRIGFADTNGREFRGIGSILLSQKLIDPAQASMGHIKKWLKENGSQAQKQMNANQRFVFHRLVDAEGPIGAQGVPLTAGRSLAVDRSFIPLGSLLWLETTGPNREAIQKMMVAQDIGGAIKGAVRGDYFWGSGHDDILELAGRMNSTGHYYILLPKTMEVPY